MTIKDLSSHDYHQDKHDDLINVKTMTMTIMYTKTMFIMTSTMTTMAINMVRLNITKITNTMTMTITMTITLTGSHNICLKFIYPTLTCPTLCISPTHQISHPSDVLILFQFSNPTTQAQAHTHTGIKVEMI